MKKETIAFIIAILVYSVTAFAYMHKTFQSKDIGKMICERLDRIETKVDKLGGF